MGLYQWVVGNGRANSRNRNREDFDLNACRHCSLVTPLPLPAGTPPPCVEARCFQSPANLLPLQWPSKERGAHSLNTWLSCSTASACLHTSMNHWLLFRHCHQSTCTHIPNRKEFLKMYPLNTPQATALIVLDDTQISMPKLLAYPKTWTPSTTPALTTHQSPGPLPFPRNWAPFLTAPVLPSCPHKRGT